MRTVTTSPTTVRPLRAEDASELAVLRLSSADTGLLTAVGRRPLEAFFRAAAVDPDSFGVVAVDGARILGYALCTTAAIRIQRGVIRSTPRLWLGMAWHVLRHPATLRRALRHLTALSRPRPARPPAGTTEGTPEPPLRLFDITVRGSARGRGIGRRLLDGVTEEARRRGYEAVGLSVLADNAAALHLYESSGFAPNRHGVRDDGKPFLTMVLRLAPVARSPESAVGS